MKRHESVRERHLIAVVVLLALLPACALGRNKGSNEAANLEPKFAPSASTLPPSNTSQPPATTAPPVVTTAPAASAAGRATSTSTTAQAMPAAAPGATPIEPTTGTITDKKGDLTLSVERPPAWADLLGGTLTRRAEGYELRIKTAGAVPSTYDTTHTINIASFFDVNGDGSIDFEVWANLASGGWGGSYFDNTRSKANRINDESLTIAPAGDELVITFPLSHLANAQRLRWALASEWGRYEVIGTTAAARDDAPDNDGAQSFPD